MIDIFLCLCGPLSVWSAVLERSTKAFSEKKMFLKPYVVTGIHSLMRNGPVLWQRKAHG
jgi:hypothetical protein